MAWPSGSGGRLHGRNGSYSRAQLYGGAGGAPYGAPVRTSNGSNIAHRSALPRASQEAHAANSLSTGNPLMPWGGANGLAHTSTMGHWRGGLTPSYNINTGGQVPAPVPVPMYIVRNSDKKDIVIRDKTHAVRRSYLEEHPKFEKEIVGYMADKTQDNIPESVVEHLINYINNDFYVNTDLLDEVCLFLLSSAVNVSSVNAVAIRNLSNWDWTGFWDWDGFTYAVLTILTSDNSNDTIRNWLKDVITTKLANQQQNERIIRQKFNSDPIKTDHPEALIRFEQLIHGQRPALARYRRA
ncbi:hypothetical protein BP6252_00729 [Coleophoma cylindrospora]|uniref:Uncharacterized protein n=1 Tax=Coleophoma cylindrospora TaxID=1849047 RepID=A0A3D8SQX4_9HELO|nr:hypothetical protein BP6252_00729 [Coleophoma cylindrospora]